MEGPLEFQLQSLSFHFMEYTGISQSYIYEMIVYGYLRRNWHSPDLDLRVLPSGSPDREAGDEETGLETEGGEDS